MHDTTYTDAQVRRELRCRSYLHTHSWPRKTGHVQRGGLEITLLPYLESILDLHDRIQNSIMLLYNIYSL